MLNFGVKITDIDCIINIENITKLVNRRNYIKGMINLRNEIIPVIDLREFMSDDENKKLLESNKLIIFDYLTKEDKVDKIGFIVDKIKNIIKTDIDKLQKPELMNKNRYIKGILNIEERLITVIELSLIIDDIISDGWKENIND